MNIKEYTEKETYCIEFLENFKNKLRLNSSEVIGFDKVISQIKYGKKYKCIVKDIKQYIVDCQTIKEGFCPSGKEVIDLIKWLEQKYFPKDDSTNKELSMLVDKIKEMLDKSMITVEELNKRLTPKD